MDLQSKTKKIKAIVSGFLVRLKALQNQRLEKKKDIEFQAEQTQIKALEQKIKNL